MENENESENENENEENLGAATEPLEEDGEDGPLTIWKKTVLFLSNHYAGVIFVLTPFIFLPVVTPFPGESWQWCAYCLCIMAVYWVSECIPLPITSFLPVLIFPLAGVMDCQTTCACYINNTIFVFLGSLIMAVAVEQSGLHNRLALATIRMIGYSHYKLLFAMSFVTMFVSMWLTNTAATTMMVPITFALLKVFEDQKLLQIYEMSGDTEVASDMTTCYFCAAAFSSAIGGIGTLVGTGTNLVFKGLLETTYPAAPEYLAFPTFSAFAIPYMLLLEGFCYLYFIILYLGFLRPKSKAAQAAKLTPEGIEAAKNTVLQNSKDLGPISFWEYMVIILFGGAILLFFLRSPQIFPGWGDLISQYFDKDNKFIRDSALAMFICFMMPLLPAFTTIIKNFTAKKHGDLPQGPIQSVLDWTRMDAAMPYSFMFLLGGGFALSTAARKEHSDLNGKIGEVLSLLQTLPNAIIVVIVITFTIFLTNFASNVAVANVVVPIGMTLAEKVNNNPLMYNLAAGFAASYCFCLPVGTPGNLVVQSAAKIPTQKMILAGLGPTVTTILISWACLLVWAPVIWPDIRKSPKDLSWAI